MLRLGSFRDRGPRRWAPTHRVSRTDGEVVSEIQEATFYAHAQCARMRLIGRAAIVVGEALSEDAILSGWLREKPLGRPQNRQNELLRPCSQICLPESITASPAPVTTIVSLLISVEFELVEDPGTPAVALPWCSVLAKAAALAS